MTAAADRAPWDRLARHALRENLTGGMPRQATSLQVGWDADALHVLFRVFDDEILATLTARDSPLYREEVVEVFLDSAGDGAGYAEIEVNPLNAVLDLFLRRIRSGWRQEFRWRCEGLRTAVARTAEGWNAELAIPFRSLAARSPEPGETWRANFCRIDRPVGRPRELSAWSPTLRGTFHEPGRFGALKFTPASPPAPCGFS